MAGCFQSALVSGQYGYFFPFFFFLNLWTKEADVFACFDKVIVVLNFLDFGVPWAALSNFDANKWLSDLCLKQNSSENKLDCKILKERVTSFKGRKVLGDSAAC